VKIYPKNAKKLFQEESQELLHVGNVKDIYTANVEGEKIYTDQQK